MELRRLLRTAAGSLSTSQSESKSLHVRVVNKGGAGWRSDWQRQAASTSSPRVATYLSSILGLQPPAGSPSCSLQPKRLLAHWNRR